MKTELLHSYSSTSLSALSKSPSTNSIPGFGRASPTLAKNGGSGGGGDLGKDGKHNSYTTLEDYVVQDDPYSRKGVGGEEEGCCSGWLKNTFTKKNITKKFPLISWLPGYNVSKLVSDFIAGLTVGLTLVPQGLAMASVAGLPPQYGLYSGFVGCFVYILFGSTQAVTIGPTAIMAIMTLTYSQDKPPEYAILLCFITGVVTLLMGLLQLGFIVNFISTPVTSGFTSAAAITICFTQVKALLGLSFPAEGFLDVTRGVISNIKDVRVNDLMVSLVCTIVLLVLRKLQTLCKCAAQCSTAMDKILWVIATSRSVIVIVVCTAIFALNGDESIVAFVGNVQGGLPPVQFPPFSFSGNGTKPVGPILPEWEEFTFMDLLRKDSSAIIVLPLLALMEHITSAKLYAGTARVDASQEMISIGISNILGSFLSNMPITGSFSRTVVNKSSGVETPLGGLLTGVLVMVALQFLTPWFYFIPKAALAAVICCAVIFTIDLDIIYPMWKSKKMDLLPWFATFAVSLLVGLQFGVLIGFLISVIFLLYWAARPGIRVKRGQTSTGIEFILLDLDRSLTFPSVDYTRYIMMKSGSVWAKGSIPLVIDCQHIQFADYTAAQGVRDLFKMFNDKNHELILYQVKPSVVRIFTSVLEINKIPFKCCTNEHELEETLEAYMRAKADKNDVKIVFTIADEDGASSDEADDNNDEGRMKRDNENLPPPPPPLPLGEGHVNKSAVFDLSRE